MGDGLDPASHPAALLLSAMGGIERIRSVRTFACEVVRLERRSSGELIGASRVTSYRAAGGRVRIETAPLEADASSSAPPGLLIVVPGHLTVAPDDGDAAERALRAARLEPRNVLAHLEERRVAIRRTGEGGAIALDLIDEAVTYRFDPATHLCAAREDLRSGAAVRYLDWRRVAGIATPFVEIHQGSGVTIELRVLAVAYDLPFPDSFFTR